MSFSTCNETPVKVTVTAVQIVITRHKYAPLFHNCFKAVSHLFHSNCENSSCGRVLIFQKTSCFQAVTETKVCRVQVSMKAAEFNVV